MTEARQHNTEIRLAVGKVGDKVDQLAAKVCVNIFNVASMEWREEFTWH